VKSLKTIIEEHERAVAKIEEEKAEKARLARQEAEAEAQRKADAENDQREEEKRHRQRAVAAKAKQPGLFDQIASWVRDQSSLSFDRKEDGSGATLSIGQAKVVFTADNPDVSTGLSLSTVPWSSLYAGWEHLGFYDGGWFLERPNGLEAFDQNAFNQLVEGWLKIYEQALSERPLGTTG
jgi:hypothetical protein